MNKSYTDIEQSRKLAEILPLESADMYYFRQIDNDYFPPNVESICPIPLYRDGKEDFNYDIRCWSLAALLGVLPLIDFTRPILIGTPKTLYKCMYNDDLKSHAYDNPVDACVAMIEKLHELNLL